MSSGVAKLKSRISREKWSWRGQIVKAIGGPKDFKQHIFISER